MSSPNSTQQTDSTVPQPKRSRTWSGVLVLVGLLIAAPVVWNWIQKSRENQLLEETRQYLSQIRDARTESDRILAGELALEALAELGISEPYPPRVELLSRTAETLLPESQVPADDTWFLEVDLASIPTADLAATAFIHFGTRRFAVAERLIAEALTREDSRVDVLRSAATIRYELGRDDETLEHCHELVELVPDDPNPWLVMCYVYRNRDDNDQLVQILPKLISRATDKPPYQLELVDSLLDLGRVDAAREEFDGIDSERSGEVPVIEARLLYMEAELASARKTLDKSFQTDQADADVWRLKAQLELAELNWDVAEEALRKVLELDSSDIESWYLLAQVAQNQGKPDDADRYRTLHKRLLDTKVRLHQLEGYASQNPGDVAVRREIVSLYEQMGQNDLADFWRRAARTAAALNDSQ